MDRIEKCLQCRLPDCRNCLAKDGRTAGKGRPSRYAFDAMEGAYDGSTESLRKLAERENVSMRTAWRWAERYRRTITGGFG